MHGLSLVATSGDGCANRWPVTEFPMGVTYFVSLERQIDGLDHLDMDGKILVKNAERLEATANTLGVPSLETFISSPPEELADFLDMEPVEFGDAAGIPEEVRAELERMNDEMNETLLHAQNEIESVKNDTGGELPPEQWFSARDGLACIRPLITHVSKDLDAYHRPRDLVADLKRLGEILEVADLNGVRFHLSVDF